MKNVLFRPDIYYFFAVVLLFFMILLIFVVGNIYHSDLHIAYITIGRFLVENSLLLLLIMGLTCMMFFFIGWYIWRSQKKKYEEATKEFAKEASKLKNSQDSDKDNINYVIDQITHIDQKTGALLVHVSIMIAVMGIFFTYWREVKKPFFQALVGVELVLYLLVACFLLRSIYVFGPEIFNKSDDDKDKSKVIESKFLLSISSRRNNYKFCLWITLFATIVFIFILLFDGARSLIETI